MTFLQQKTATNLVAAHLFCNKKTATWSFVAV